MFLFGGVALVLAGVSLWVNLPPRERMPAWRRARCAELEWFKDAKFGLMITWGPVSLVGTEISWSRQGPRPGRFEDGGEYGSVPVEEYDQLYRRFNPTGFDAREYVRLAQAAGAKYIVFVTKHHDGFCMFDSALTEYKITRSPFGRDVTAELAAACHQAGLKLGFYYSPPDWHHPAYGTPRHEEYLRYMEGQLTELCTRYGRVDVMWFDGLVYRARDWDPNALFRLVRGLQPGVLINDRAGMDGDFRTLDFERVIGRYDDKHVWETCMPLGDQWAYEPGDRLRTLEECVRDLARCAGGGGNYLLNIGPGPDGRLDARMVRRLEEVGAWLARHGESIYGTRPGPFPPDEWGVSTYREDVIYLHVLRPVTRISLPPLARSVAQASTLAGAAVKVRQTSEGLTLTPPPDVFDGIDTIIALRLKEAGAPGGRIE